MDRTIIQLAVSLLLAILFVSVLFRVLKSPYHYPYKVISFDISGMRSPQIEDLLDRYLNANGLNEFTAHYEYVQKWKTENFTHAKRSILSHLRTKQLNRVIDDVSMFIFHTERQQTRYSQHNYQRISYKASVITGEFFCNFHILEGRYQALKEIDFSCTLSEAASKKQRSLMTKALRAEIAYRDHYTCQSCGKYMPDGVGLQIDHIVPIAKGGKTVHTNLQVLCSVCNGRKSSK